MKVLKVAVFIVIVAGVYFAFLRDRFIDYPIQMTLTNVDGEALSVYIIGRSERVVQFQKTGGSQVFDFSTSRLNTLSKVKLTFLPKTTESAGAEYTGGAEGESHNGSEVSNMHLQGMQDKMQVYMDERARLEGEYRNIVPGASTSNVDAELRLLDLKISKLTKQMSEHAARAR